MSVIYIMCVNRYVNLEAVAAEQVSILIPQEGVLDSGLPLRGVGRKELRNNHVAGKFGKVLLEIFHLDSWR
jgi:hypothetical protein